jgi:BAHD acyltransferase
LRANSTNKKETTKSVENGSDFSPAPAVTVTGKKSVAPAKNRCTLATFYLHYITFYYNQKLLLYRAPDGCFLDAVERMTAVLADALHVFYLAMATRSRARRCPPRLLPGYPFAGRIRQDADGALAMEEDKGIPWQSGQQSRRFLSPVSGVNLMEAKNISLTSRK